MLSSFIFLAVLIFSSTGDYIIYLNFNTRVCSHLKFFSLALALNFFPFSLLKHNCHFCFIPHPFSCLVSSHQNNQWEIIFLAYSNLSRWLGQFSKFKKEEEIILKDSSETVFILFPLVLSSVSVRVQIFFVHFNCKKTWLKHLPCWLSVERSGLI